MKKQTTIIALFLIANCLIASCQKKQTDLIKGVWHFTDKNAPKSNIKTLTEETENGEIKTINLEKEYEETGSLNFFLTFENETLTQKMFGLKLTNEFIIKDDLIYLGEDDKPFFKIIKLNKKVLIVERIDSGRQTKYGKLSSDSPLLKLSE
ncbi:hypothetical protein [Psychroserpens mesophilus]|uniref:hypothetical protein n=1 Tax=Psychroserpens mesophilus TaxID=325473 RepID=UPI00058BF3FC|nr:hypothetical protein [Psychroserpens mesophilus]